MAERTLIIIEPDAVQRRLIAHIYHLRSLFA